MSDIEHEYLKEIAVLKARIAELEAENRTLLAGARLQMERAIVAEKELEEINMTLGNILYAHGGNRSCIHVDKELEETLHALHHHEDCEAAKKVEAKRGELAKEILHFFDIYDSESEDKIYEHEFRLRERLAAWEAEK